MRRVLHWGWWVGLWLLAGCAGAADTALPTIAAPAATLESGAATVSLPPTNTPAAIISPDALATVTAVDLVLAEIDAEVCREAMATRAEIEVLLQQGQDVADLATAVEELIAELEGCASTVTPPP